MNVAKSYCVVAYPTLGRYKDDPNGPSREIFVWHLHAPGEQVGSAGKLVRSGIRPDQVAEVAEWLRLWNDNVARVRPLVDPGPCPF